MDEHTHDWDGGPPDGDRESEPSRLAAATPEPPSGLRDAEPSQEPASSSFVWLPRAAGGGAAAVSAPAALLSEPTLPHPVDATADRPASAPVELLQYAPPPVSRQPPEPSVPGVSAGETGSAVVPFPAEPAFVRVAAEHSIFRPQPIAAASAQARAVTVRAPSLTLPLPRAPVAPRRYLRRAARLLSLLLVALAGLMLALIALYRWVDPPISSLMLGQWLAGEAITQRWVPLGRISPNLHLATIMSEDGRFCRHRGVDWDELNEAIENARDGVPRGGSTITMQVVKNLFLWPSKSYLRKAIEIPLSYVVEAAWSKRRILEIYLNIAEWGPGVFGAEAAARFHFRKSAYQLSPREAALLAVSLPNPFERQAGSPGPGTSRLADNLLARMRTAQANAFCVRGR